MSAGASQKFDNALFITFALFVFCSTFSIAASQMFLGLSLATFIIISIWTRCNPFGGQLKPFYIAVAAYVGWMILASLLGATPLRSLLILKEEWLFCIVPIGIYLFSRERYRNKLIGSLALGVAVISVYGIIQHFTGIHWFKSAPPKVALDGNYAAFGMFSHSLTFGGYYSIAAAFLVGFGLLAVRRAESAGKLILAAGVLGILATISSYSRTAVVVLLISLPILGALKNRRWMIGLLTLTVLLAGTVYLIFPGLVSKFARSSDRETTGAHQSSRLFIWTKSAEMALENPIFGVGPGNFEIEYAALIPVGDRSRPHAHNDILNVAAVSGIPGAILFMAAWLIIFRFNCRSYRSVKGTASKTSPFLVATLGGSLVFFANSLTESTFADEEVRQALMFMWATGLWPMYNTRSGQETYKTKRLDN